MRSIGPAAVVTSLGLLAQVKAFPLEPPTLATREAEAKSELRLPAPEVGLEKKAADPGSQAQDLDGQLIEVRGVSDA